MLARCAQAELAAGSVLIEWRLFASAVVLGTSFPLGLRL